MQDPSDHDHSGDELQFEHAEVNDPQIPAVCAGCSAPLDGTYWEINGKLSCEQCHQKALAARTGGSRFGRFVRAGFYGFVAALIAALMWGGVRWATGYEVGIVAIVVGIVVGVAVKQGSRGRGGVGYQLMAAFLTYFSICTTYVPILIAQLDDRYGSEVTSSQPAGLGTTTAPSSQPAGLVIASIPGSQPAGGLVDEDEDEAERPLDATTADKTSRAEGKEPAFVTRLKSGQGGVGTLAIAILVLVLVALALCVFAMALPIFGLFGGEIMWVIIIGIGVWTAWKINRREELTIRGPFELAPAGDEASSSYESST